MLHTRNGDRRGGGGGRPCGAHKASPRLIPPASPPRCSAAFPRAENQARGQYRGIQSERRAASRPLVSSFSSFSPPSAPFSCLRRPFPLSLRRHVPFSSRRHFVDSFARFARPDQARLALAGRVPPPVRLSVPSAWCIAPASMQRGNRLREKVDGGRGFRISLSFSLSF